jgi:hypothetical protein
VIVDRNRKGPSERGATGNQAQYAEQPGHTVACPIRPDASTYKSERDEHQGEQQDSMQKGKSVQLAADDGESRTGGIEQPVSAFIMKQLQLVTAPDRSQDQCR